MSTTLIVLFLITVGLDVLGQLWFKLGLTRLPEKLVTDHIGIFWQRVFSSPLLWAGIATYVVELGLWLAVLANAPLSFVFPLASLSYVGVMIASHFVLEETISPRRWAGALVITAGVAVVYIGGQG